MIELLGTIGILAFATVCIYYRRFFSKKTLNGRTVLVSAAYVTYIDINNFLYLHIQKMTHKI